jgi:uncharacterized membrane protein YfcA
VHNVAKAVGLFAGASTTITSSAMNFRRKALDIAQLWPMALGMLLFAPLGAWLNRFVDQELVKALFVLLLLYSATMMMFGKKKALTHLHSKAVLLAVGSGVGLVSGLLGVGGGNLLIPLLIFLGFEPRKVAVAVSFVVPFSALGSFFTYASYVPLDWRLLLLIALASIAGGYLGNYLMHFKLNQQQIKKIMALILYILAFKMLYGLL